jgi:Skp family chaperone for outer membrane proteins
MIVLVRICMMAVVAATLAVAAPARAAEPLPKATVAVLDFRFLMREASAAKDARQQLDVYRSQYQKEISKRESALRKEEQELKDQRAVLTEQAFEAKRRAFEQKVVQVQRAVQDRSRELDRSYNAAMAEIQKAVVPIVKDLTVEMGFNVVVDESQVLFAKRSLDITSKVLAELNKKMPKVEVPKPAK